MAKYIAKQITVNADRWYRFGDAPGVVEHRGNGPTCKKCSAPASSHGWLLGRMEFVCPGNWIIADADDDIFQMTNDVFLKKYEKADG